MSDFEREIISDIRHSAGVDNYTNEQRKFLWSVAERLESLQAARQGGEVEPVGFVSAIALNHLKAGRPAKIYPASATPSPFEPHTLVFTHPPATTQGVPESVVTAARGYLLSDGPYDWSSSDRELAVKTLSERGLLAAPNHPSGDSFQNRVAPWMQACFGPEISADKMERNHRFLEESLELVQSLGCTKHEAIQLVDYVYGREVGDPPQEVGGVMVTLAALCLASDMDMHQCGETELARIWTKVEKIRAKQAAKPKHSPLPEHPSGQWVRCDDLKRVIGDLEYAAYNLCEAETVEGLEKRGNGRIVESTCPETSLLIALRDLSEIAGLTQPPKDKQEDSGDE